MFSLVFALAFLTLSQSAWIGEEYWANVDEDGRLMFNRRKEELIQFEATHLHRSDDNAYVAFWIQRDGFPDSRRHFEAFGHASFEGDRLIGRFVDAFGRPLTLRGGFRVLARSSNTGHNPFRFVDASLANKVEAVGYRRQYAAKIVSYQKNEGWFGTVKLAERFASGVDYDGVVVDGNSDPSYYDRYIFVLTMPDSGWVAPAPPRRPKSEETFYHSPNWRHRRH